MEELTLSDMRALLAFVADCHQRRTFEEFVPHLLKTLPQLIPATHITYNEMDPRTSTSHNWVNTTELATPSAGELWQQHMDEHAMMRRFLQMGSRKAVRISEFWRRRELHDRGLYFDFYRHFSIEDALCLIIPCPPPIVIGVGWHDDRAFTDREKLIGELVRPHIAQALRNARMISHCKCQLDLLNDGIEDAGCAAILCTSSGKIQRISALARRYIVQYFGTVRGIACRVPDELLCWMRREQAIVSTNNILPSTPMVLAKNGIRLIVHLLAQDEECLLLMKEEVPGPSACDLEHLGLTRREAEVLACVAQGKTNKEVAGLLGMHSRTVQKHLEHIFQKLGVDTRTAAAALAFASSW